MKLDPTRALMAYSAVLTGALVWMLLTGAASPRTATLDTLDVHRINVREGDGTLRLVIASRDHFPGAFWHKREIKRPDRADSAGLLFLNDEGTENGGLIFGGRRTDGKVDSFGHLSFDQYEQDQVISLDQSDGGGRHRGGLTIADYPDKPIDWALMDRLEKLPPDERKAQIDRLAESGELGHRRLFVGKSSDRDALLALQDGQGRTRLQLRVTLSGSASIEFLDEAGRVVRTVTPAQLSH